MSSSSETLLLKIQLDIQGDPALKAMTRNMRDVAKQAPRTGRALKQATTNTRRFGNTAQNVGFQVQDLAVQIQGGTDVTRALSQQLPQMLVGFGAWGAAIGVVTALLPTLIKLTSDSDVAVETFATSLGEVDSAISLLNQTTSGLNFNSWNEAWNTATVAIKEAEIALLEFRNVAAQGRIDQALATFKAEQAEQSGETWGQSFLDGVYSVIGGEGLSEADRATANLAKSLGIDEVSTLLLQDVIAQYESGKIALTEFKDQLVEIGKTTPTVSREFAALVENIVSLTNDTNQLAEATKQASLARNALATGAALPTGKKPKSSTADSLDATADAATLAAIALNDYNQQQEEYLQAQYDLQIQYGKTAEEHAESLTIQAQAVQIFEKNFETAVNGIAAGTQSISDAFENMAKGIIATLLKLSIQAAITSAFPSIQFAKGGVIDGGNVVPFANGGVVGGPTVFPMSSGVGLMGEAGPEAIVPLTRMPSGDLGVQTSPVQVTINNMAQDVAVSARETDGGLTIDVVMNQIANAVQRGGNEVANALEDSYALSRGRSIY